MVQNFDYDLFLCCCVITVVAVLSVHSFRYPPLLLIILFIISMPMYGLTWDVKVPLGPDVINHNIHVYFTNSLVYTDVLPIGLCRLPCVLQYHRSTNY